MRIQKVNVENYRILKDFELDFRKDISLIVGKNNCGKTSVITVMNKFLGTKEVNCSWNDFNIEFQKNFFDKIKNYVEDRNEDSFIAEGIRLQVYIEYDEFDNYVNIQKFMMNLDPRNNIIILEFFYCCNEDKFKQLKIDIEKHTEVDTHEKFSKYMNKNSSKYFELQRYSREFDIERNEAIDNLSGQIDFIEIEKLINIKVIKANREVSNKINDSSLSGLTQRYYNTQYFEEDLYLSKLQEAIEDADNSLSEAYNGLDELPGIFTEIFKSVKRFGSEADITIQSTISETDLLRNNTTLYYRTDNCHLPESYNGLGYLNLIGMIFEIETIISRFHRKENEKSADINMLFIEEPEAHTHPQLQYVFIRNIRELINERRIKNDIAINIQTVITTHSSHIVSECDFDDIRYLKKVEQSLVSKNFQELICEYESDTLAFKFVKQYLNLNRSELFFTEKAVFIEGDTERILLPAMMKQIDLENTNIKNYIPLLSQNISVIEVGAYAHIFQPLIDFLGIKVLIITDIDPAKKEKKIDKNGTERTVLKSCSAKDTPTHSTNASIKSFLNLEDTDNQYNQIISKSPNDKILNNCRIAYQINEKGYQACSFEDSFICLNIEYIKENLDNFSQGIKKKEMFEEDCLDFYVLANQCVAKKSSFAAEILFYNGETNGKVWETPAYIKEGLRWLQKQ